MKKKGSKKVESEIDLSKSQIEILKGLSNFLTINQIAKYRNTSRTSVYKGLKILLRKGFISKLGKASFSITDKGKEGLHSITEFKGKIRLHNFSIKAKVLESPTNWNIKRNEIVFLKCFNKQVSLGKNNDYEISNIFNIKIKSTPKSIIFYMPTTYGNTIEEALEQSMDLFFKNISKVENLFKIRLIKDNKISIEIISQHYARLNDSLAKIYQKENDKLFITGDDGKVWLIADLSFNVNELEAIHTINAQDDLNSVSGFLNDLRKNPTTFSEQKEINNQFQNILSQVIEVQHLESRNIIKHQKVLDEMLITLKKIQESLDRNI